MKPELYRCSRCKRAMGAPAIVCYGCAVVIAFEWALIAVFALLVVHCAL